MDKEKCFFYFSGYYVVAAASELLSRYKIRNRIVKGSVKRRNSCNFALMVERPDVQMSRCIFERAGICVERAECVETNRII